MGTGHLVSRTRATPDACTDPAVGTAVWGVGDAPSTGRAVVIVEQIRTLEGRLRSLRLERDYGDGYPRDKHGDGGSGDGVDKPPLTPMDGGQRTSCGNTPVVMEMGIEAQIEAIAGEIETLRVELGREQRLAEELPPAYA